MAAQEVIELFAKQSPVCVMVRATLENILSDARLNDLFEETAQRQYCRELTFASCAGLMSLPGQTIPILDPQRKLIEDVIVCEDGHANERSLIPQVLERVQAGQCWIGDRAYSTMDLFFGTAQRKAKFIIRQHSGLKGELQGRRRKIGPTETGVVYEQTLRITHSDGRASDVRRITVDLDGKTNQGEAEVQLLTNLPSRVSARKIADAYRQRWRIETAFAEVTTTLRCELNTLGYPDAALFGFCIALLIYNVLSVTQAALRASQTETRKIERNISMYALTDEIAGVWRGMEIAVPHDAWTETYARLTPKQLASRLLALARKTNLKRFTTHTWTPKQKQPKRKSGNHGNHVSTQRILETRS